VTPTVCREPPPVTVAVVSWNTRDLLAACLDSLKRDVDRRIAEVWVVDNQSTDGSAAMVADRFPWARLECPDSNLGFGRAVNLVARSTSSAWIAPANSDIELLPGTLETLLAAGAEIPTAGILAPRLVLPDGTTQPSVQRFPSVWLSLGRRLRLQRLSARLGSRLSLSGYWDPLRPATVDWATGAFLLVRRSAWDAVGGFDEAQWMYAEDLDLAWRLRRAGWISRYVPEAVARHHHGAAAVQAFDGHEGRRRREIEADYRWLARRHGVIHAWAMAGVNLGGAVAELAVLRLLTLVWPHRYAKRATRARGALRRATLGLRSPRRLVAPEHRPGE
jgi:N-acetylglucosaminyl-diphospho-decaprenol L-rhamnosyltransferase